MEKIKVNNYKDEKASTLICSADSYEKGEVKEGWLERISVCSTVLRKFWRGWSVVFKLKSPVRTVLPVAGMDLYYHPCNDLSMFGSRLWEAQSWHEPKPMKGSCWSCQSNASHKRCSGGNIFMVYTEEVIYVNKNSSTQCKAIKTPSEIQIK